MNNSEIQNITVGVIGVWYISTPNRLLRVNKCCTPVFRERYFGLCWRDMVAYLEIRTESVVKVAKGTKCCTMVLGKRE